MAAVSAMAQKEEAKWRLLHLIYGLLKAKLSTKFVCARVDMTERFLTSFWF